MSEATERLLVRIDATTEQLRRELKRADDVVAGTSGRISRQLGKVGDSLEKITRVGAKWAAGMAAAGAAATTALVKSGLQSADALAKTADKLGVTTDALAALRFAAEQTGVKTNEFDIALQRFTRRLADAAEGAGPAARAFDEMGLSAKALVELSPDEALAKVADKMNLVENQSQKVSLAFKLFDSGGVGLVNTLALGSEGLGEMAKQAEAAGLALSRMDAAKAEAANDAMARVGALMTGLSQQLAVKFAPILEGIADRVFGISQEMGGMGGVADKSFRFMAKAAGWFLQSIQALQVAWHGMKLAFQEAARFIAIKFDALGKHLTDIWNKLPFVDKVKYKGALSGFIATMDSEIAKSRKKMDDLLSEPLATVAVEDFVNETTRQFEAQAIAVGDAQAEVREAIVETDEATKDLAATTQEAATTIEAATVQVESAWTKALQGTAERIDSAFASAWKGAFDSFADFADGIKSAFRELLGELAHMAITRPIIMNIGAAFGLGGAASAASAAGGAGGIMSGGGSILSMLSGGASGALGSLGGAYTAAGNYLLGSSSSILSGAGRSALDIGRNYSYGSIGSGLAGVGMNLGAGFAGNYLGGQVFGDTSGIGSLAGGAVGSLFGPIGTGVGSFLGAGIESALGNVFGFGGKGGNQAGRADLNLATGTLDAYGVGNKFDQENVDAAQQLAQVIQAFSNTIGGSTAELNFKVGNRSGLAFNGQKFGKDSDAIIAAAMKEVIEGATGLSATLKTLMQRFSGTADETMAYAQSIVSIESMLADNPVQLAVQNFAEASELAGYRITDIYQKQIESLDDLIYGFDGSVESAMALNAALSQNTQLAYDMALALQSIGESTRTAVRDEVGYFQESIRSPDEQLQYMEGQLKFLDALIPQLTDPDQILAARDKALEINRAIFDAGPSDLQAANVDTFIDFARHVGDATQIALDNAMGNLELSQQDLNTQVSAMLEVSAQGFQESSNTMQSAAQLMYQAVQDFIAGNQYSQVVA